jgi:predicted RND superfamily exporter protein
MTNRFPGTYNASVLLKSDGSTALTDPDTVAVVSALQGFWSDNGIVGLSTSYVDVVGSDVDSQEAIEASLASQAGIGSLITDDLTKANLQLLLKSGDNQAMQKVVDRTDAFLLAQPLPDGVTAEWGGETYLNLVWQDKMVTGMFKAFMGTFAVVFILLVVLFRFVRWAVLAILPLTVSIVLVYGVMGFAGKDYDMPLAVLSTLALGIAVDFAIHFIQRYRELAKETVQGTPVMGQMFEEPARAISRNALIVALGFLPMLFASLLPYVIVAALMSSIMVLSWLVSLLLLPALITLFKKEHGKEEVTA